MGIANSSRTPGRAALRRFHPVPTGLGLLALRSLFPLVALLLLWSTPLLGPWTLLVLALAWWRCVTHIA